MFIRAIGNKSVQAAFIFALLLAIYFWPVIFWGRVISANDALYFFPPWHINRPQDVKAPSNLLLSDQWMQFYPFQSFIKQTCWRDFPPLWNPYIFAGTHFLANMQSAVFYPLNVLFGLLPLSSAFTHVAILKLFVAGLGAYLFARSIATSHAGALLSGLVFMLCGFNIVWLNYPMTNASAMLPLIFWAVERVFDSASMRWASALALLVGIQLFGGHPETSFHSAAALALYVIFRMCVAWFKVGSRRPLCAPLLFCLCGYAGGMLLAAVVLLPFADALKSSVMFEARRAWAGAPNASALLKYALMLFIPDLYGSARGRWLGPAEDAINYSVNYNELTGYTGILPLVLAAVAASFGLRSKMFFFACMAVFSLVLVYRVPPFAQALLSLPILNVAVPYRLLLLYGFAVAILAGKGLDLCLGSVRAGSEGSPIARREIIWRIVLPISLAAALIAAIPFMRLSALEPILGRAYSEPHLFSAMVRNVAWFLGLVAASLLFVFMSARSKAPEKPFAASVLCLLAIGLTFLDLYRFGADYNPTTSHKDVFSPVPPAVRFLQQEEGPFRVIGLKLALLPNVGMIYGLQDVRGYDFPIPRRFRRFFDELIVEGQSPPVESAVFGIRNAFHLVDSIDGKNLKFLSLLNVKYVVSDRQIKADDAALKLTYDGEVKVYRNLKALPRAFIVHRAFAVGSQDQALSALADASVDIGRTAVLSDGAAGEPLSSYLSRLRGGPSDANCCLAKVEAYDPHQVRIRANASRAGFLILADAYDEGWEAHVDGHKRAIYPAYYLLRAVYVDEGEHEVTFVYRPFSFRLGLILSMCALAAISVGFLISGRLRIDPS